MILCVTLNPCLDKTLLVPAWHPGDAQVRGRDVRQVVGGKGNNVARALTCLGRQARPATFLGGATGRHCEHLLRSVEGFDPLVVPTAAETRTILTVRTEGTDQQTGFFDPDATISEDDADALHRAVEAELAGGTIELLTLSGSSPSPSTHHLYSDLIALARARRVPVLLDTYGPALAAVWGFWPDVLQMNRHEAAGTSPSSSSGNGSGRASDDAALALLADWGRHGVKVGVITDGPDDVLVQAGGERFRVTPPEVEALNPIGSGDCLLAGIADAMLGGRDTEALVRHAVACAVANTLTWDAGKVDPAEVARLAPLVTIEPLGPAPADPAASSGLMRRTEARRR
jgi:1-phosphofructokinase family hexose kinase